MSWMNTTSWPNAEIAKKGCAEADSSREPRYWDVFDVYVLVHLFPEIDRLMMSVLGPK